MSGMHRNRIISLRRAVQTVSAVLINGYGIGFVRGRIFAGKSKAFCVPVLNCYSCPGALGACPVGALQTALGGRNGHIPFYVLGTLMLFGVVLGRVACGFLCPFGFLQDLLYKIPAPKLKVPKRLDRWGRMVKYGMLLIPVTALPLLVTTDTGITPPYFCKYLCPAGTFEGGIPLLWANEGLRQAAGLLFDWKLFVLLAVLGACLLVHRPFCRYLCPLGAFYGLFNRFSFFQMHLDSSKCVDCKSCERACPMAVEVTKNINSPECIRCGKCREVCPARAISPRMVWGTGNEEPADAKGGTQN